MAVTRNADYGSILILAALAVLGAPSSAALSEPQSSPQWSGPDFEAIFPPPRNPREQKTLQAMRIARSVDLVDRRLDDALKSLLDAADVPFVIDYKSLDEAGIGADALVSLQVRRVTLESALRLILAPLDLAWRLDGELLLVTTADEAGQELDMRLYDVNDLMRSVHARNEQEGLQIIVDLVQSICSPTTWDCVGGPGSIDKFAGRRGVLIVSQTTTVHVEMFRLLARLRYSQGLPLQLEIPRELRDALPLEIPYSNRFVGPPDPLGDIWQRRKGGER